MVRTVAGRTVHPMFSASLEPMARAIGPSLGPNGRAVLCERRGRVARLGTGVDIAREIASGGSGTSIASRMLTETLVEADRDLGDGTARLALIAEASFRAAARYAAGGLPAGKLAEAIDRRRGELPAMLADECGGGIDPEHVAMTAGADLNYALALAKAFHDVGPSGEIEVVASRQQGIRTNLSPGFVFDAIPASSAMPDGEALSLQDVHVIAADDIIADFGTLLPVIEAFAEKKKSLLIAAREISGPALATLERNRRAGILSVLAVTPFDAGPQAAELIEDLALATGAALVADRSGLPLSRLKPAMLGHAGSLRLAGHRLELREPGGDPSAVSARARSLEEEIRRNRYLSLDRERASRRRARLLGRWAEIEIGGFNDMETERLIEIGSRAVACMRSAQHGGIVAGGGLALSSVADRLESSAGDSIASAAGRIVAEGLRCIRLHLRRNAMGEARLSSESGGAHPSDPISNSVVDPLRMTQLIVDRALSVATSLLRVDAAVLR